jgi:pyrroline-5-carboxylate reductase
MSSPASNSIGFLGAGQMATALAQGWLRAGLATPQSLWASDPVPAAREGFAARTGASATASNREVVAQSGLLVLAVKPQVMKPLLDEIRADVTGQHLVVSIAAGIRLRFLEEHLGRDRRLVRVMPNTPCLVGECAAGWCASDRATPDDAALIERLLNAVGRAFRLPEHLLDAVTGLSGSGPAFVFVMIEALADGGVKMGLPREVATVLAAQTVLGSARMLLAGNGHPAKLKDAVASPGGTTIAGLHALERAGFRAALLDAVEAATRRAQELGQG